MWLEDQGVPFDDASADDIFLKLNFQAGLGIKEMPYEVNHERRALFCEFAEDGPGAGNLIACIAQGGIFEYSPIPLFVTYSATADSIPLFVHSVREVQFNKICDSSESWASDIIEDAWFVGKNDDSILTDEDDIKNMVSSAQHYPNKQILVIRLYKNSAHIDRVVPFINGKIAKVRAIQTCRRITTTVEYMQELNRRTERPQVFFQSNTFNTRELVLKLFRELGRDSEILQVDFPMKDTKGGGKCYRGYAFLTLKSEQVRDDMLKEYRKGRENAKFFVEARVVKPVA
jgi:hypothetical protein